MCIVTATATSKRSILITNNGIKNMTVVKIVSHIKETEAILAFSGMALCILKLVIYGPSLG